MKTGEACGGTEKWVVGGGWSCARPIRTRAFQPGPRAVWERLFGLSERPERGRSTRIEVDEARVWVGGVYQGTPSKPSLRTFLILTGTADPAKRQVLGVSLIRPAPQLQVRVSWGASP